ncbi:MAG: type ISP restriction/modification enzyme [Chitinophagaceae bacterium]|nr:type ISP restriction/modification enzyme [Chitinophagaceae bacterium]
MRAKLLKDFLLEELIRQEKEHTEGRLYQLYETFKTYVFHELTVSEFSDAFAQNLVYGLFLAKLNAGVKPVSLNNAWDYIPATFELIRELVDFLKELKRDEYRETKWIVEEVLTIMNHLDLKAIQDSLSFTKRRKDKDDLTIKDPYVYFYEDFLAAYDKKLREAKGVYYTPPPVVNFIVRAINDILKDTFHIKDGLADRHKVTVLDFATGTGTFLVEILQQIFDTLPKGSGKKELLIKEHVLKNLFGFEYLIAPYTIAHLKLSQFLKDNDYELQPGERLHVFLTNTLEPIPVQIKIPLLPALTEESKQAQNVKDKPVLVITGNPPYNIKSKNKGEWILEKIKVYKDGLREKKINLDDDYIKFLRFAEWKMENVDRGMVAVITNNSFYDGITHRQMRKHLLQSFDEIYCLNLHGSIKRKEKSPDGSIDENVFDIEQGVAISIFIKKSKKSSENLSKLYVGDFWGERNYKYKTLYKESIGSTGFSQINPKEPYFFFSNADFSLEDSYNNGIKLSEVFVNYNSGVKTDRDTLFIDFDPGELTDKINTLLSEKYSPDFKNNFNVNDSSSFKLLRKIKEKKYNPEKKLPYLYRPFDTRFIYYDEGILSRPAYSTMKNFLTTPNIAIVTCRQQSTFDFQHILVANKLCDCCLISSQTKEFGYVFPLYQTVGEEVQENFNQNFRSRINKTYKYHFPPEEIVGYIYAILHSHTYRSKYAEFLKIDFPRIPFTENKNLFQQLAALGSELIQVHLLQNKDSIDKNLGHYFGKTHIVEKPEYRIVEKTGRLFINKESYFDNVPREVYEFYIGGYHVLDKYLKDRKGRNILKEIDHIAEIVQALAFTIKQMQKIDSLTKSWI